RRLFFVIFAPDSQQESSPLSGRKSTQATVRICGASSLARSACEAHRTWIEEQVRLKRNAQAIYQDLVDQFGFP
ncbi:hypothetical protein, partial [Bradyrhizobium sp. Mp27]|uniref:hypothetical protein n=1 Tax=Bradyrhizobium sp. Mp27 TaxID=3042157 RepID=UPI00248C9A2E